MEEKTQKLLIEAENSIWIMQNNQNNKEIFVKFSQKLVTISQQIANEIEPPENNTKIN